MIVLDWDDVKYFLAVARAGQMLGAAKRIGVSQATLSRRITALETSLNQKLLIRRTHGCEMTEAGRALLPEFEQIEAAFLKVQMQQDKTETRLTGTVRIGAPDGFGISFLAPRIGELSRQHPDLHIQLVPIQRSFSLSQREADIAILVGRPVKGRLTGKKLTDYTLGLYASKDYIRRFGTPQQLKDLNDHSLLGYVDDLNATPSLNYVQDFLQGWRSTIEIASSVGQLEAIRAGAGIGILHDFMVYGMNDLLPILAAKKITRPYWIAWHSSQSDVLRIKTVANFIAALVKQNRALFSHPDEQ